MRKPTPNAAANRHWLNSYENHVKKKLKISGVGAAQNRGPQDQGGLNSTTQGLDSKPKK